MLTTSDPFVIPAHDKCLYRKIEVSVPLRSFTKRLGKKAGQTPSGQKGPPGLLSLPR